jgi:gamma-glutamylcyclotransferase (GGCT)/AIG2-like uncharacterized protein YtfP
MLHKIFVYGTLMVLEIRRQFVDRKVSIEKCSLKGFIMSEIKSGDETYPVIVADENATYPIQGEVFEVTDNELNKLDEYEGEEYKRIKIQTDLGHIAWTYIRNK